MSYNSLWLNFKIDYMVLFCVQSSCSLVNFHHYIVDLYAVKTPISVLVTVMPRVTE
jgi:hypothetical protein